MATQRELAGYWTPIYNAFNPFQPVPPDKLKTWFVDRPDSPLQSILTHFGPRHTLERLTLAGHPANGKSSELTRLASQLAEPDYGYFVINIDMARNISVERVNQIEVLFLIGAACYKLARDLELKPDKKLFEALTKSLETIVQTYTENKEFKIDVATLLRGLVAFGLGVAGGPVGVASAPVVNDSLRDFNFISGTDSALVRKLEVEPKIGEILNHVNNIIEDVRIRAGNRPIVLLVDGLDRIRNEEVIGALFVHNRFLADVQCRVLYTVPVYVYYQPQFAAMRQAFQTTPFPNVRLRHKGDHTTKDEAGYETLHQVITKRLNSLPEPRLDAITPEAMDLLISASAGLMRDLIRLMRDATVKAQTLGQKQITPEVARSVVAALRREYEAQLTPKYQAILDEVRKTQRRTESPDCDLLLKGNFILSYSNEQIWYDVHSILW